MSQSPSNVQFSGNILYLTKDPEKLRQQLSLKSVEISTNEELIDNISTDEITPGWVCFWYDETLGEYCLVGLRGGDVKQLNIKNTGADVIVSGLSKGCGSSRETAPFSEKSAGIKLVVAKTIEKIYGQNCRNIGLLTTTDFSILDRIKKGESIPLSEFTKGLDPIATGVVENGGLFAYNRARLKGEISPPLPTHAKIPMTLVEKIIASCVVVDAKVQKIGVECVRPGEAVFCATDIRFSHEYVTPMAESLFKSGFGDDAKVKDPKSVFAFRDHLTLLGDVMSNEQKEKGLLKRANNLAVVQQRFTETHNVRLFGEHKDGGSEAICHNAVFEELASPGQLVIGSDSHTCTAGALGCFAFGVGSTDMANAWYTKDVQVTVPQSVRIELKGKPGPDITAKDIMLYLMTHTEIKDGSSIGKVMEIVGDGLAHINMDERATLTNMAVESGFTTGIIAPDEMTAHYLMNARGLNKTEAYANFLNSDADANYAFSLTLDLTKIKPMVATPGDPRNGINIEDLNQDEPIRIDIAYGGSCTGGKMADMDMYAAVLQQGFENGQSVKPHVQLYIQFGSQRIKKYAQDKGYIELFRNVGVKTIEPSCGACIKAGPGISTKPNQVSISAINRNFPGRSGPGQVYLASPRVVAASALAGYVVTPEKWFSNT